MNTYSANQVALTAVPAPQLDAEQPVLLSDATMAERLQKVLTRMKKRGLETLVIYGDVEHGSNFEYLTGFITRFEEGLLVLQQNGDACLVLGNENTKMANYSRIPAKMLHSPFFSLPNQPMEDERPIKDILREAGVKSYAKTGLVGWKNFTSTIVDNRRLFDLPAYLVETVQQIAGSENVENATDLFIGAEGARTTNNANEIAHYEYGAALASDCVLRTMNAVREGISELELGSLMNAQGQRTNVVTICATGDRYEKANLYPSAKTVKVGDKMSLTTGYKGGLASRCGYVVEDSSQLPESSQDYIQVIAAPYFAAIVAWLENIHIGISGAEMYNLVDQVLPRSEYHWSLCPGHLTADEEWMSSPVYAGSTEQLASGMLLQIDIIPSKSGYAGVCTGYCRTWDCKSFGNDLGSQSNA